MSFVIEYISQSLNRVDLGKRIAREGCLSDARRTEFENILLLQWKRTEELFDVAIKGKKLSVFDATTLLKNPMFRLSLSLVYDHVRTLRQEGAALKPGIFDITYAGVVEDSQNANSALLELGRNKSFIRAIQPSRPKLTGRLLIYAGGLRGVALSDSVMIGYEAPDVERIKEGSRQAQRDLAEGYAEIMSYKF